MLTTNKRLFEIYDCCEKLYLADFERIVKKRPETSIVEEDGNKVLVVRAADVTYKIYMSDEYYVIRDVSYRCCGQLFLTSDRDDNLRVIQLQIGEDSLILMTHDDIFGGIPEWYLKDMEYGKTELWETQNEPDRAEKMDRYLEMQAARLNDCLAGEDEYCYYEDRLPEDRQVLYERLEDLVVELLAGTDAI